MTHGNHKNSKRPFPPGKRISTCVRTGIVIWLSVLFTAALAAAHDSDNWHEPASVHIALSGGTFVEVNPNDAQAAVKAWGQTILKQRGIVTEVETMVFQKTEALVEALKNRQADAAAMLAEEFIRMEAKPDAVFLSSRNNSFTERYVLLVHRHSGIDAVDKLLGHQLVLHHNPKTSLASAWLDTLLASHALGFPEEVFESMTRIENASKAVLRVFFRQVDACIVTANVFDIVSELNPQVRKDLRVIARSPEVIPTLFFFRPDYTAEVKGKLEDALVALHETPAGQQVLMIFQGERMEKHPIACLESSQQLLEKADRLRRRSSTGEKPHLSKVNDNAKN